MKLPRGVSGADVIRALEQADFKILRQEGSHVRLGRGAVRVTVPLHAAVAPLGPQYPSINVGQALPPVHSYFSTALAQVDSRRGTVDTRWQNP